MRVSVCLSPARAPQPVPSRGEWAERGALQQGLEQGCGSQSGCLCQLLGPVSVPPTKWRCGAGRECVCLPANFKLAQPVSKGVSGWGITLTGSQCFHAWGPCEQGVSVGWEHECIGVCSEPRSGPTSNWETCRGGKWRLDAGRWPSEGSCWCSGDPWMHECFCTWERDVCVCSSDLLPLPVQAEGT